MHIFKIVKPERAYQRERLVKLKLAFSHVEAPSVSPAGNGATAQICGMGNSSSFVLPCLLCGYWDSSLRLVWWWRLCWVWGDMAHSVHQNLGQHSRRQYSDLFSLPIKLFAPHQGMYLHSVEWRIPGLTQLQETIDIKSLLWQLSHLLSTLGDAIIPVILSCKGRR